MTLLIKNARIVLPYRVTAAQGWMMVKDGLIAALGEGDAPGAETSIDAESQYLFPGLIDLQINGGGGLNFNDVQNAQDLTTILEANLATGTTGLLATFITDQPNQLVEKIKTVSELASSSGAHILGLHIEGPFLSPEKSGMHAADRVALPDVGITKNIIEAGQSKIKIMTLAPELPGALEVVRFLKAQNVIAAMSHSMASYEDTENALQAGASMGTHLFNTMPPIHHRTPGMIPALLNSTADLGIIADGEHIDDRILQMVFKIKGPNYFLVSDAIAPLGSDLKEFDYHGSKVWVENGLCYISKDVRAGSVTPLFNGVIRAHQKLGFSLPEAVALGSLTPATIINADTHCGSIAIGKQADFLIVGNDFKLQQVYKAGQKFNRVYNL